MTTQPSIESLRSDVDQITDAWGMPISSAQAIGRKLHSAFSELESLRAENARLVAERDALKQWHDQHEEREAASCPEDVGCIEFIGYLKDSLTAERARADALAARVEIWRAFLNSTPVADLSARDARIRREEREAAAVKVDELAALVRLLVHSIRKHSPDNETARRAMDYLKRHELQGSPLRGLSPAPDAAKPNNQQDQP